MLLRGNIMKLSEIIRQIENIAPLAIAAPWDNSGMQVAALRRDIAHLAVMLDPTPGNIQKALDMGADMILSHHPLAIKARMPDTLGDFHTVLRLLFCHDIPLYSAHTSLDANLHGPAAWLAEALALTNRKALEKTAECSESEQLYGFGIVGELPRAMPYHAFAQKLAALLGKGAWRACGPEPETVTRMAYCPGSGESMLHAAVAAGVDIYITGDVKYHAALETPVRVLDVGHFILEEIMMRTFANTLRETCAPLTVSFFEAVDPFVFEGTPGHPYI